MTIFGELDLSNTKKKSKVFTITNSKFKTILDDVQDTYNLLTETIKNNIPNDNDWEEKPIEYAVGVFYNTVVMKQLLYDMKLKSEEVKKTAKLKTDDLVVLEEDLLILQNLYAAVEEMKEEMSILHNISLVKN